MRYKRGDVVVSAMGHYWVIVRYMKKNGCYQIRDDNGNLFSINERLLVKPIAAGMART
jgi:hypothetical protein